MNAERLRVMASADRMGFSVRPTQKLPWWPILRNWERYRQGEIPQALYTKKT